MRRLGLKCLLLIFSVLLLPAVLSLMHGERYEGAREVGEDLRRIPLGFPYEVISEVPFSEARVHEWETFGSIRMSDRDGLKATPGQGEALMDISRFCFKKGVLCGTRVPLTAAWRPFSGPRYVVLTTDPVSVRTFEHEAEFLEACKMYGIDGTQLEDFSMNHARYWDCSAMTKLRRVVMSFVHEPFSRVEWGILAICVCLTLTAYKLSGVNALRQKYDNDV